MSKTANPDLHDAAQQRPHTALLGSALASRLDRVLAAESGEPLVTFLDHGTGERTELSAATVANWAVKFANLLQYEVGDAADATDVTDVGARFAGDTVTHAEAGTGRATHRGVLGVVDLATAGHWAAVPAALGSWRLGMAVRPHEAITGDPDQAIDAPAADLRIAHEDVAEPGDLAVGPGLGGRLSPDARADRAFVDEVLREADDLDADDPPPTAVAVLADGEGIAVLSDLAAELEGVTGRRVLLLDPVDSWPGLVALAAVVCHGGALVIVRDPDRARLAPLVEAERVTVAAGTAEALARTAGPDLPGLASLTLPA